MKILNREVLSYAIFGILTSLLNIFLFAGLLSFNLDYKIANIITLIVVKIVAFLLNKFFVFKSKNENLFELLKEIYRYILTRGTTMIIDFIGLVILIDLLNFNSMISKVIITVIVVILNYILGKKYVFKTKNCY